MNKKAAKQMQTMRKMQYEILQLLLQYLFALST